MSARNDAQAPTRNLQPGVYPLGDLSGLLTTSKPWAHNVHRGFGKTANWAGKYLYGAFSSLVASYVIGFEFYDDLPIINAWQEHPDAADQIIADMWARYL